MYVLLYSAIGVVGSESNNIMIWGPVVKSTGRGNGARKCDDVANAALGLLSDNNSGHPSAYAKIVNTSHCQSAS